MLLFYSQVMPKFVCFVIYFLVFSGSTSAVVLRAYVSQHGLHGEIEFSNKNETHISIRTNLQPTLQYPDQVWRLAIHEFPVDYRILENERCSEEFLGKELTDLTEEIGYLIIPGKERAEFESKHELIGQHGLWGKSLVFRTAENDRVICASILSIDKSFETHAVAKFASPVAGTIHFRWLFLKESDEADSYIETDLYHSKAVMTKADHTEHKWKILVTDIFDSDKGTNEDNCDALQLVFDPESNGEGMSVGDLDNRFGLVKVATDGTVKKYKTLYKDEVINVLRSDIEVTTRNLYLVIYDTRQDDAFLACAKLRVMESRTLKALINMDGIRGQVELTQRSPYDPTWSTFRLAASDGDYESNLRYVSSMMRYSINELPPKFTGENEKYCNTTGNLYNPMNIEAKDVPPAGLGTQDQYPTGDLLGKYKGRTEYLAHGYLLPGVANELSGAYWDVYLPLQGPRSVAHRSIVLERRSQHSICGTLHLYQPGTEYQLPMSSAEAVYRYPLVARVVFRQPKDRPWDDVTVIIEEMIHADGSSVNTTHEHRWAIHTNPPGADYYNWTARCVSAGPQLLTKGVDVDLRRTAAYCRQGLEGLCPWGDLTARHGTLTIAGSKRVSQALTRRLFTDTTISISGRQSAMRKSLVLFDDHGPVARGERLACSLINGLHNRKAVIRDWFANGESVVSVRGRAEFTQQSEYDVTNVHFTVEGLDTDIVNYKIHEVPVQRDLEFPCEKTSLLDTYNPYKVDKNTSPPPTLGTADQYELGDLGYKYGLLDDQKIINKYFNETQLSLFGPYSVLGRSLVFHRKQVKGRHQSCATVERGYSPSEAREIRTIASFHHPQGFATGFVRMTQLIHNDGSQSDTILEVNLRHPGERDRNLTHEHRWEVWVNPVSVDATVPSAGVRCVAAGYRWNPHLTQLADPLNRDLYHQECGPDNPLRCDVGDLTSRLGTISVGGPRLLFSDSNLPLEGAVSASGRSLVVFNPQRSNDRMACAVIQPDNDIVKYVNLMKPPRFVLSQFLQQVRAVMGVPDWFVTVDSRKTRTLYHGACIQLLLHFTGPHALDLERDLNRLLQSGRLDAPSIYIPGYVNTKRKKTISYKLCGVTDINEKKKKDRFFFSSSGTSARSSFASHHLILSLAFITRLLFR